MARVRFSFGSRHTGHLENIRKQRTPYPDVVNQVISESDIILEVLDARFVLETRNPELEAQILESGKKLIYVLNKADLVHETNVARSLDIAPAIFVSCTKRRGSVKLRDVIKRLAKSIPVSERPHGRVYVGVIGYPNTGKSSVLNFLTGKSSAKTANQPGFTKGLQKIRLTRDIIIFDTPGVIAHEDYSMHETAKIAKHAKVGSRSYNNVRDPDLIVQELLLDATCRTKLEEFYGAHIEDDDADLFLEMIGRRKKFLKKGGVVDIDRAARLVLRDWQEGLVKKS